LLQKANQKVPPELINLQKRGYGKGSKTVANQGVEDSEATINTEEIVDTAEASCTTSDRTAELEAEEEVSTDQRPPGTQETRAEASQEEASTDLAQEVAKKTDSKAERSVCTTAR